MFHDDCCWVPAARLVVGGREGGGELFGIVDVTCENANPIAIPRPASLTDELPLSSFKAQHHCKKKLFLCFDKKRLKEKTSLRNNQ